VTHGLPDGSTERDRGAGRAWSLLPEVLNACVLGVPLLLCLQATLMPYSDDAIRASLVDTYEPSAWGIWAGGAFTAVGVLLAVMTYRIARRPWRRRAAIAQALLLIVCLALQTSAHYRLMLRTTALTGQTFAGFP
jgi:hypothetical protein